MLPLTDLATFLPDDWRVAAPLPDGYSARDGLLFRDGVVVEAVGSDDVVPLLQHLIPR